MFTGAPRNAIRMAAGPFDGYLGVALLFATLEVGAAGYRAEAHAHLSAGPAAPRRAREYRQQKCRKFLEGPTSR
jgi:hypothetical protein